MGFLGMGWVGEGGWGLGKGRRGDDGKGRGGVFVAVCLTRTDRFCVRLDGWRHAERMWELGDVT